MESLGRRGARSGAAGDPGRAKARRGPAEVVRVRLVFLGAAGVGKTALIRRFLHGAFEPRHRRTVEELHVLELDLDPDAEPEPERKGATRAARRLRLELLDTSGSYSFPAMRRLGIRRGDAFALVYSPHEPGSFEEAERLRREIVEAKRDAPLVVAANKSDLPAPPGLGGAEPGGAPPAETVERLWGARYLEVSAKHDHNVAQLFRDLLAQVRLPGGSLSPALRRRSNPELWPREPAPSAAGQGQAPRRPSCAIC
ncbi:ras-related protein Rap-1b-like [Pogona vitticeps]